VVDPGAGYFTRDGSGSVRRLDSRSVSPDDEYEQSGLLDSNAQDTGSIRWTAGPPPAKTRADRDREVAALAGPLPAGSDGYAQWQDEPPEDDWVDDDADSGLLSRRFGGGGAEPAGSGGGSRGRGSGRGRKRRSVRGKVAFTVAIFAVILIVGIAAAFGTTYVSRLINNRYGDYKGAGYGHVTVIVPEGASLGELGPMLLRKGVIMALRPYDTAAAAATGTLQPGVYKLQLHMNSALAVQALLSSKARSADQITIIEGTRAVDIAKIFAKRTGLPSSAFMDIIDHPPSALGLPSWAGSTAEGFLFPDTYELTPHETPLQILQMMVSNFNHRIAGMSLATAARTVNTTPWHVLIVASMVQAESGKGDFGKVARVAWNRLGSGMPLHFDSTVFYGLGIAGGPTAAATNAEINKDTPYNTYMHKGLPPGPIGNPGLEAIQAALHPPHGPWLYFITDLKVHPSKTYFTDNYSQFQKWQQQFEG